MNERIEIVSDRCVWITVIGGGQKLRLVGDPAGNYYIESDGRSGVSDSGFQVCTDAQGRDALIDALQCLRDTNSFAALSDESAVPYTGKKMCDDRGRVVTILGPDYCSNYWVTSIENGRAGVWHGDAIKPLSCIAWRPKVRPYKFADMELNLGRKFKVRHSSGQWKEEELIGAALRYVIGRTRNYDYEELANECRWTDTNEPCGVIES